MLRILDPGGSRLREIEPGGRVPAGAVWVDLNEPTPAEVQLVEEVIGHAVPTREEMEDIAVSSRLYKEGGATFMTATVLAVSGRDMPLAAPVSFILTGHRLVTVRHHDPRAFEHYASTLMREGAPEDGTGVFVGLVSMIVDRLAEILKNVGQEIDDISHQLLSRREGARAGELSETYDVLLRETGRANNRATKSQQSLMELSRMLGYVRLNDEASEASDDIEILRHDLKSLVDHNSYLNGKIAFLLEAIMGMINIQQSGIIKIFSVMAVIFLPPTLVASIYGMNFEFMPELQWTLGYPFALFLMVLVAIGPYWYFKRKKWL